MTLLCDHLALQEPPASLSASSTWGRAKNTRGSHPRVQHSGKSSRGSGSRGRALPRVSKIVNSGKTSASATVALGEDLTPSAVFFTLLRVQHSGKKFHFFNLFPECNTRGRNSVFLLENSSLSASCPGTRGRPVSFFLISLPRVPGAKALGEGPGLFFNLPFPECQVPSETP
jgi:hypothetical protein